MRIIKELEGAGYVKREQRRDPVTKSFGKMEFYVYDAPAADDEPSQNNDTDQGQTEPDADKPLTAKPQAVDPDHGEPQTAIGIGNKYKNIKNNNINTPLPPTGQTSQPKPEPEKRRRRQRQSETPSPPERQQVFVVQYSPQWEAWIKHRGKACPVKDYRDPKSGRYQPGWWFPSEWPPDHPQTQPSQGEQEGQRG